MKLPSLVAPLAALLLLAGCSETPPTVEADAPPPAEPAAEPLEPRVKEWDGEITGAGAILPGGGIQFVGRFTTPEGFNLEEGRTALTVDLTWDALAPTPMYLVVLDEEGRHLAESAFPYDGSKGVTLRVDSPLPGAWNAIGLVNGTAADVRYHIRVAIE